MCPTRHTSPGAPLPEAARRRPPLWWAVAALALLVAVDLVLLAVAWRLGLGAVPTAVAAVVSVALIAVAAIALRALRAASAPAASSSSATVPPPELAAEPPGLRMLHRRAVHLFGSSGLEELLQTTVEQAADLLAARYGGLSVQGAAGRILEFVFTGMPENEALKLAHPPKGTGLLGVPLHEGQSLRVPRIGDDPRSVGFPEHHPPMTSLLAVPIPCRGPFRGNLYLSDKLDAEEFSAEDEEVLTRFAEVAGVAIDSAHLRERQEALAVAEERLRIAHEMHDGMAQVLGYVNTKAQAVGDHLRAGRPQEAITQMDQLARAAREVYSQVREGILSLRANLSPEADLTSDLAGFVERWQEQSGIAVDSELGATEDARLSPLAELQVLRIVQEALTNVRRHSGAGRVAVSLAQEGNFLVAVVADDGTGFDPEAVAAGPGQHFGLDVMRERAEAVGGTLEVRSRLGDGTRVEARVPLAPPAF